MFSKLRERVNQVDSQGVVSLASSALVHLTIFVILACIILPNGRPEIVTTVNAGFSSLDSDALETLTLDAPEVADNEKSSQPIATLANIRVQASEATPNVSPFTESARVLELSTTGLAAGSASERVAPLSTNGGANAQGAGAGGAGTKGNGKAFFGLSMAGSNVVFVVDSSGSMNYPHPGPAKTRFGRVKFELLSTITAMSKEQQFFIVFFNGQAIPMPADQLVKATVDAQRYYLTWMASLKARGATDPETALMLALSLQPDVIYFLTDGRFDYRTVPRITRFNRRGVVINTIGFGDNRGEQFLKEIAARNQGTYKFIPETEQHVEAAVSVLQSQ